MQTNNSPKTTTHKKSSQVAKNNSVAELDAQKKLRESEERYRAFIANSSEGIWRIELEQPVDTSLPEAEQIEQFYRYGYMAECNDTMARMYGYETAEALFGKRLGELLIKEDEDNIAYLTAFIQSKYKLNEIESHEQIADGSDRYFANSLVGIIENNHLVRAWGIQKDVTQRKQDQKAMQLVQREADQRKRLYEVMAGSTPDLIYIFDLNYRFTYANPALLEMWGKTWDEAIGKNLLENGYEPWHAEMHEREIDQVVATKQPIRGEVAFPHATLGRRIYDYIFTPVIDSEGNVEAVAGTTRDITEIVELSRQKDDFIGIATHELKTPVTSVKAYAQALQQKFTRDGDNAAAELMAKMDAQLNKLTNLIGELLDATKIDAGELKLHPEDFELDELVLEQIASMQLTTSQHTLSRAGDTGIILHADRDRIGQIFTNLLSNAIKYSPDATDIVIRIRRKKDMVEIGVKDHGVGIAKDKQNRIFERFYRVSGPKQDTFPGLGLGLYISSVIITQHQGKIWVDSAAGKGATFWFSLPLTKR